MARDFPELPPVTGEILNCMIDWGLTAWPLGEHEHHARLKVGGALITLTRWALADKPASIAAWLRGGALATVISIPRFVESSGTDLEQVVGLLMFYSRAVGGWRVPPPPAWNPDPSKHWIPGGKPSRFLDVVPR
jgi:hypothetical protein